MKLVLLTIRLNKLPNKIKKTLKTEPGRESYGRNQLDYV